MKIIPLSEGSFTIDHTKIFVPFHKEKDDLKLRAPGSLLVEIQPFAVITEADIIVLDTGLGFANANGILQLHQNLIDNNINPAEVTKVLLSHLHKDHSGGIKNNQNNHTGLSFPNAEYYLSKSEIEYASQKGSPSYTFDDFAYLQSSGQLKMLTVEAGMINNNISFEVLGGHTPSHTVFWIKEKGDTVFFGGDVSPQLQQMKSRFIAKYDYDGKKCMELRTKWWLQGEAEHWTFLFYHDIKTPCFKR